MPRFYNGKLIRSMAEIAADQAEAGEKLKELTEQAAEINEEIAEQIEVVTALAEEQQMVVAAEEEMPFEDKTNELGRNT